MEALLFLRDRGISTHGHLHSGNVIIQNGVARYGLLISGMSVCVCVCDTDTHKKKENLRECIFLFMTSVQLVRLDRQ